MARGSVYAPERAIMRDSRSGLKVTRLTHGPTISTNLYFEMCAFSKNEQHVMFMAQRYAGRDAPFDLFRARTDGTELVQMTEYDDIHGVVVAPEREAVYYQTGGEVRRIGIESLQEDAVAKAPAAERQRPGYTLGTVDRGGKVYFSNCRTAENRTSLFRVDLDSGRLEVIFESEMQNHLHVSPDGSTLHFNAMTDDGAEPKFIAADGSNLRAYTFRNFAHHTWFGTEGLMQGTLLPPGHALATYSEGDEQPTILTEGRYYWHSSPSADAQWIVSDTNWPREGLYLFHLPSGTVTWLCDPQASCSHPQWTTLTRPSHQN